MRSSNTPAEAARPHHAACEVQDAFHVLDGQDLAVVNALHVPGDGPAHQGLDETRRALESVQTLEVGLHLVGGRGHLLDETTPAYVTQEIFRVVLGLEVPLLALTVFEAELTHDGTALRRFRRCDVSR